MSFEGKRNSKTQNSVVVLPGRTDKPDPASSGQVKLKDPTCHGNGVSVDDLPWTMCAHPPLLSSMVGRAPPRGISGEIDSEGPPGHRKLKFIYPEINNPDKSMPGGKNLFKENADIFKNWQHKENYFPMPDIKETKKRGATIREVVEKGEQFSTSLLKGLPINSSLFAMLEQKLPEKQNVETAKEQFNNILSSSLISKLPGTNMSLGSMFSKLTKKNKSSIKKSVPPEVFDAFESLAFLLPTVSTDSNVGYISNMRVNEEVFMQNVLHIISQCKDLAGLNEALLKLISDKTLWGLDLLDDITIEIETPFGNVIQVISATGNLSLATSNTNNVTANAVSSFSDFMGSGSASGGAPSISPGENLFGDSSALMMDMFNRLAPESLKSSVELIKNTNSTPQAIKRNNIMRVFSEGGGLVETFMKNLG